MFRLFWSGARMTIPEIDPVEADRLFEEASMRWFHLSGKDFKYEYDHGIINQDEAKAHFVDSLRRLAGQ